MCFPFRSPWQLRCLLLVSGLLLSFGSGCESSKRTLSETAPMSARAGSIAAARHLRPDAGGRPIDRLAAGASAGAHAGRRRFGIAMRRTARIASALLLPFMAGCGTYAALDNASPDASRITNLHWLIFWVTGGVSIVLIGALLIALISRRTSQTRAGEWLRTVAVAAAGVFSILVLLGLLT